MERERERKKNKILILNYIEIPLSVFSFTPFVLIHHLKCIKSFFVLNFDGSLLLLLNFYSRLEYIK